MWVILHLHSICGSRSVDRWYVGFMLNKQSYITALRWSGCLVLNSRQLLIENRKVLLSYRHSRAFWTFVFSFAEHRASPAFCSNSCLFYCNWSKERVQKLRFHHNQSTHRQWKSEPILFSERLNISVSGFFANYSEVTNPVMMLLIFFSLSPDDSSSRGAAGTSAGDTEHAPELAVKLGKHFLNQPPQFIKRFTAWRWHVR